MKRFLLTAAVTVSVTGLLGAGWALADGMMGGGNMGSGSGSSGPSGAATGYSSAENSAGTSKRGPYLIDILRGKTTAANKPAATTATNTGAATTAANKPAATTATNTGAATTVANAGAVTTVAAKPAAGSTSVGGIFPMVMGGADSKIDVKNLDNGVSLTITSADPATAARLQKMAEAMRLMQEAMRP